MKKLFYTFFVLVLTVFLAVILHYDSQIIIITNKYEIITSIRMLVLILTAFFLFIQMIFSIINVITRTDKEKIIKKINKKIKIYENYIINVKKSIIYSLADNFNEAYKKIKNAEKYLKNDLTDLIKFHILLKEKKYQESINSIAKLDLKMDKKFSEELLLNNIKLSNAVETKNYEEIKIFADKILQKDAKNIKCLSLLYNVYKKEQNYVLCEKIIFKIKKTMSFGDFKKELLYLNENLAEFYFKNNDFSNAFYYSLKVFKENKNIYTNNRILILSIRNEKHSKLNDYIKKIWRHTPKIWIGNLYLNDFSLSKKIKNAKNLYLINKSNINSVIFFCKILVENNRIDLVTEEMINILQDYDYKEVFELLLKIEEKNKANSFLSEKYKEKIVTAKRIENE